MNKETFLSLLKDIPDKARKAEFSKKVYIKSGVEIEFLAHIFSLDKDEVLKLLKTGEFNYIFNPHLPPQSSSGKYFFDDEQMRELTNLLSHVQITIGFLGAGWESLCYTEYSGNTALIPSLMLKVPDRNKTFSFLVFHYTIEEGGVLSGAAGFGDSMKEAGEEVEIRTIHNFGRC